MYRVLFVWICALPYCCFSQSFQVEKVEPPNWWVGMKWNTVQLMVYGEDLGGIHVKVEPKGPEVLEVIHLANNHYAFIDLHIPTGLEAGDYQLILQKDSKEISISFPILPRNSTADIHKGFDALDVVYLITPDRFADGDTTNQNHRTTVDEYDPTRHGKRHGGDLQGVIEHLDYLQELGITALWLNPILENAGINSYHGYKTTNFYAIDPRFGSNELYKKLVEEAHKRGIKIIFDHINNHIGIQHPWMKDLPMKTWVNGSIEEHWNNKHYKKAISDPYAEPLNLKMLQDFWFVDRMPDLNQRNPYLANYLIQNTLWWIEYSGIDGIREDTYPYPDQAYMARWAKTIMEEYPDFNIMGEIWDKSSAYIARYQQGTLFPKEYDSHLPTVMDFPLSIAFRDFLEGKGAMREIYEVYADDFVYADPQKLLVFLDNHDMERSVYIAKNTERIKLALGILLTARGIPQIFYGTEINLLAGGSHVELRRDFPGGFPYHDRNAFTEEGRTNAENEMFHYLQKLLQVRKKHPGLAMGKLTHYRPIDDIYMYLKEYEGKRYWIIANGNEEEKEVPLWDIQHRLEGVEQLEDLIEGRSIPFSITEGIQIGAMSFKVFKL